MAKGLFKLDPVDLPVDAIGKNYPLNAVLRTIPDGLPEVGVPKV